MFQKKELQTLVDDLKKKNETNARMGKLTGDTLGTFTAK